MELEAEHKFPVRKVPCASGSRLHFSWGTGHCLNLVDCCARSNLATHTGIQSAQHVATTLRWYFPSETMRRVSCDVQPHHEGLQQKRYSGAIVEGSAEWAEEVERYSRTISSVMGRDNDVREPPLQLNREMLEAGKFPEEDPFVPWQRALWELLEVFFIDKGSARDIIAEDLAQWLRRNWSVLGLASEAPGSEGNPWAELRDEAAKGALAASGVESHPRYWECLHRAVALGWTGMAEDMLGWHSAWRRAAAADSAGQRNRGCEAEVGALEAAQSLLRSMPHFCREGSVDITGRAFSELPEFLQYRQRWVMQCQQFLGTEELGDVWEDCEASSPGTAEGLRGLLRLLAGEEQAIQAATTSWLELLVAEVLHRYPDLKAQMELKPLMDQCVAVSGRPPSEAWGATLREVLEAAADGDVQTAVAALQRDPFLTPWFLCHATDVLGAASSHAHEMLHRPLDFHGCTQAEHYVLDYAMSLMPYPSSWELAAKYLSWCPSHGLEALRLLVERLPVSSDNGDLRMARKVISLCEYHGQQLGGLATGVCRTVAMGALCEGNVGAALSWFLRAHDGLRASLAAKPFVERAEAALLDGTTEVAEIPGLRQIALSVLAGGTEFARKSPSDLSVGAEPSGRGWLEFLLRSPTRHPLHHRGIGRTSSASCHRNWTGV
mmetsp:Transcript_41762/g.99065  ORF Transcript_41762/g.99065 Transcript_41762/m.99065 type:complete len:664 (-) Transcript_41762:581-2572(-)